MARHASWGGQVCRERWISYAAVDYFGMRRWTELAGWKTPVSLEIHQHDCSQKNHNCPTIHVSRTSLGVQDPEPWLRCRCENRL